MLLTRARLADGRRRDVRVQHGTITRLAPADELAPDTDERHADLDDRLLLPGAVDPHVHFREPGASHKETWTTGSRSAAAGGVTTVIDQPNTDPPTTTGAAYDRKRRLADASLVDYGIAGGVTPDWEPETLFDRPLAALGEVFLADSTGDMGIDTETFRAAAARAAEADRVCTVHTEDAALFEPDALPANGPAGRAADAARWSRYRPAEAEIAAVEDALATARETGVSVHVAHTSTPEAVERVVDARASGEATGVPDTDDATRTVTCEVTPHHLFCSHEDATELGTYGRMNPPLRNEDRRARLFDALREGRVDCVATDHAPHTREEKERPLREAPSGVPGVETAVPMLLAAAREDRLSLERVRDVTAANAARIFDLPPKGRVAEGADADLAVYDLDTTRTIRGEELHSNCGWTPFEGREGVFPDLTLVRGHVAYDRHGTLREESFGGSVGRNVRG